jgi:hypothetical protein
MEKMEMWILFVFVNGYLHAYSAVTSQEFDNKAAADAAADAVKAANPPGIVITVVVSKG